MAKGAIAKLIKLKCMIKRWNQRSKSSSSSSSSSSKKPNNTTTTATTTTATTNISWSKQETNHLQPPTNTVTSNNKEDPVLDLQPVYVGRSRRRYLISSQLVDHPLFRVLIQKSGEEEEEEETEVVVGCEVVMFDHLLWMLENNEDDGETRRKESVDELVGFYSSF